MFVKLFPSLYLLAQLDIMLCSWQNPGFLSLINFWSLNVPE